MADFTKSELKRAKQAKEEELYQKEGYKKAVILGRSFLDYENHLFAFLIDLNICLVPVYVWGVEFILILSGVIPPAYFDLLFYLMYALLFMTSCILLPLYTANTGGYSWGGRYMGLRLVRPNRKPAPAIRLVLRQLFGFGIPMMLFGYFFSAFGIAGWWLLSGLIT
ncbi:MAG: RDD family protein, partial [Allobaculum sp.]|nr:RDD family protein [Allobaculum sp.]